MDPTHPQIYEVPPYLRVHKDGTVERYAGIAVVPPGIDPHTNVISKDITIIPETGVTARLYSPNNSTSEKLPLIVYFHGGAYCIASSSDPVYHNSLNKLVAEANIIAISVNYRLAPEHPLPAAYDDSWEAVQWIASHAAENGEENDYESWLKEKVDFNKVFLAGDSAGANIGNYIALKDHNFNFKILGLIMVNPYFWGKEPIGEETSDDLKRRMVDRWWELVCPSDKGNDDPLINPFVEEAPRLEGLGVEKVLVTVCEKDILIERGKLYHNKLVNSGWKGTVSHAYTRYLGDLSGGQLLKRMARRSMNLPTAPRNATVQEISRLPIEQVEGTEFYDFLQIPDANSFKNMYRQTLDSLSVTSEIAQQMVVEANVAFRLNMELFQELDEIAGFTDPDAPKELPKTLPNSHPEIPAKDPAAPAAQCPFSTMFSSKPKTSAPKLAPEQTTEQILRPHPAASSHKQLYYVAFLLTILIAAFAVLFARVQ